MNITILGLIVLCVILITLLLTKKEQIKIIEKQIRVPVENEKAKFRILELENQLRNVQLQVDERIKFYLEQIREKEAVLGKYQDYHAQWKDKVEQNFKLNNQLLNEKLNLEKQLKIRDQEICDVVSQKKSSEVRTGLIVETFAPLLDVCPYDSRDMIFLGRPIDYLVFDKKKNEVVFLEIKSGNSVESTRQKAIKQAILDGKVYYDIIRLTKDQASYRRSK